MEGIPAASLGWNLSLSLGKPPESPRSRHSFGAAGKAPQWHLPSDLRSQPDPWKCMEIRCVYSYEQTHPHRCLWDNQQATQSGAGLPWPRWAPAHPLGMVLEWVWSQRKMESVLNGPSSKISTQDTEFPKVSGGQQMKRFLRKIPVKLRCRLFKVIIFG